MGKRKAAKKPQAKKKREPLPTIFPCLFCNHEKSCEVKLDKKYMTGKLKCKVCGQTNSMNINYLSAAVDVYADWVDKCDEAARLDREEQAATAAASARPSSRPLTQTQTRDRTPELSRRRDNEIEDLDAEGEDDDLNDGGSAGGGGYSGARIVQEDDDY